MKRALWQVLVLTVSIAAGYLVCLVIRPGTRSHDATVVASEPPPALVATASTTYWVGRFDSQHIQSEGADAVSWTLDPVATMLERQHKDLIDSRPVQ